jgi:hypothetical protein
MVFWSGCVWAGEVGGGVDPHTRGGVASSLRREQRKGHAGSILLHPFFRKPTFFGMGRIRAVRGEGRPMDLKSIGRPSA